MSLESEEHLAFEAAEAGDYARARQLLLPLVRQGSTYARDLIAWIWDPEERLAFEALEAGDYERSRELSAPLAREGSVHAMHLLGWMHEYGRLADSRKTTAISCYRKAAEGGITRAFYYAGMLLLETGERSEARRLFEHGVVLGSMQSMYGLGRCLEDGETDHERQQSVRWFEKAAALGHFFSKRRLLGISAQQSLSGKIMVIPRLLKLMGGGVVLIAKDRNSERLY